MQIRTTIILFFILFISTSLLGKDSPQPKKEAPLSSYMMEAVSLLEASPKSRYKFLRRLREELKGGNVQHPRILKSLLSEVKSWDDQIAEKINTQGFESLLGEYEKAAANSADLQLSLSNTYDLFYEALPPGHPRKDLFREKALSIAEEMVSKFPKEEKVYHHYAFFQWKWRKDPLDIIKTYQKCLEVFPQSEECRRAIGTLAEDYERPYCPKGSLVKDFGIYLGRGDENRRKLSNDFESETPFLHREDFGAIVSRRDAEGTLILQAYFEPAGREKFANLTKKNVGQRAVLYAAGKVLSAPKIMEEVLADDLALPSKIDLETVCRDISRRELPAELKKLFSR